MKKLLGVTTLLMGLGLLGWIGYNLLFEMQESARGRSSVLAIFSRLVSFTKATIGLVMADLTWPHMEKILPFGSGEP